MDVEEKLYVVQMKNWLKEQEVLKSQLERAVEYHKELAESHNSISVLNKIQLQAHNDRVDRGRKEYQEWLKENNISQGGEGQ